MGKREEAAEVVQNLSRGRGSGPDVSLFRGQILEEAGEMGRAAEEYLSFLQQNPSSAQAHAGLVRARRALGLRPSQITAQLVGVLSRDPSLSSSLGGLAGEAFLALGDPKTAIAYYEAALKTRPDDARLYSSYGTALTAADPEGLNSMEIVAALERAVDPLASPKEKAVSLGRLAEAQNAAGKHKEAVKNWQQSISLSSTGASFHRLGYALEKLGERGAAIGSYREAIDRAPGDPGGHQGLARLARSPKEAKNILRAAVRSSPTSATIYNELAMLLLDNEAESKEAIALYQAAVESAPDSSVLHNNYATALAKANHTAEARAAFERAIALEPAMTDARAGLATLLLEAKHYTEAVEHYEALAKRDKKYEGHAEKVRIKGRESEAIATIIENVTMQVMAKLEARFTSVEERLTSLEARTPGEATLGEDRLGRIEHRLAGLEKPPPGTCDD